MNLQGGWPKGGDARAGWSEWRALGRWGLAKNQTLTALQEHLGPSYPLASTSFNFAAAFPLSTLGVSPETPIPSFNFAVNDIVLSVSLIATLVHAGPPPTQTNQNSLGQVGPASK